MTPLEVLRQWSRSTSTQSGPVRDEVFDTMYPEWIVELSEMFWTPVEVAVRSAELLVSEPGDRILDIGSGVGKFCLVGAATSAGIFHGVEQRPELVDIARDVQHAHPWSAELLAFRVGNMSDEPWEQYQGVYLFNPFFEQTSGPWCQIDQSIRYSRDTQERYIQTALAKLQTMRVGSRVATYFGFGGEIPANFRKTCYEHFERGPLEIWVKER